MTPPKIKLMGAVCLAVVAVIWIVQNGGLVQTKFLFFTVTMPQPALLAITLLVGGAAGILLTLYQSEKARKADK